MVIVGTRPEIIRLAAVIHRLQRTVELVLVHTGQNYDYELNEVFFRDLDLPKPKHFLEAAGETASQTMGNVIISADRVIREERPDAVLILGDTNSCVAALPARKNRVPVYHMEAGNRCFDLDVPEELNRRMVDHIADFNLVYTEHARRHLIAEGLPQRRIYLTGSPMAEVLATYRKKIEESDILARLNLQPGGYFIASFHREENVDREDNLSSILNALTVLARQHGKPVIVSTHPRTRKRIDEMGRKIPDDLHLLKPFGFHDYNRLQMSAGCAISDSGTISEEASILGFPAVTIRNAIERPEALDTGSIIVTGLASQTIIDGVTMAMADFAAGEIPPVPVDYQITNTSQRVVRLILGTAGLNERWHGTQPSIS
ncbi:MAG: UDP-N-acetylglucosamine 2-epimerase (non-hydrolyzing) [Rhodobiaceae bacterium]|nr:UDP-N-acetylglucosamine 2-epimerase (non-hydrolyzing) [Rhodobiaceae bacterium]